MVKKGIETMKEKEKGIVWAMLWCAVIYDITIGFCFGLLLILISGKITPQWQEFQDLGRTTYLTFSLVFLLLALILLRGLIRKIIRKVKND